MIGTILIILALAIFIFCFSKMDCHLYLWFLNKFAMGPSYTQHLRGQVVWITGASSGIGEYIAYEYAMIGCKLVLSGTNEARLDAVKNKCLDINSNLSIADVLVVPFDISDYSKHVTAFDRVIGHFKQIDILVNNAGRSQRAAFENINIEVDEQMFKVNVFGPIHLTRLVVRYWNDTRHRGQIAVTSSVAGIVPAPMSTTYSATKFSLHGYFETLRAESFGALKITILCPGPVFSRVLENSFTETPGVKVNKSHSTDANRMSTERCAKLCVSAITHRVNEAWISIQPILSLCYLNRHIPYAVVLIFNKFITKEKLMKLREGS